MGNLSNQYISQSFQSLLHLGSDTTASATLTEIQDALGNGIGVFVNNAGNLRVTNHISASQVSASILNGLGSPFAFSSSVSTQLQALENVTSSLINKTGSYATTGSNTFIGNQNITGDVEIIGTLNATRINTLIESSSIIFSSGSNILGDSSSDIQTLNGLVRVSGSSQITGSMSVSGSSISFKGEVSASYISSSRIQGLGNTTVSDFSASVAQQFNNGITYENNNDTKWNDLQPVTSSLLISVNANLNPFTASILGTNAFTASINQYTSSNNTKWNTLGNLSGSFLITASVSASTITFTKQDTSTFNIAVTAGFPFTGSAQITGSLGVTGSISLMSGSFTGSLVNNITDTYTSTARVNSIVSLTSAEYSALTPKDANTLYIVI